MVTRHASALLGVSGAVVAGLLCPAAAARELWAADDGERSVELETALKASTLAPADSAALSLWRLRFGLGATLGPSAKIEAAYEHRTRTTPGGTAGGLGVLPAGAEAPYRIAQLDEAVVEVDNAGGDTVYSHRHELDRALIALHFDRAEVTIGRQAVGWGRGVLFGAVDVFSAFSPLEVDREWRRGVDAVRADIRLTDTYSLDIVGAFGEDWDNSALLGRLRGYSGNLDSELIFGKRGGDTMYAGTVSAAVGGAAVHGEVACFETPEKFYDGGFFGDDHYVAKAILGASYTFDVGDGLSLFVEYHFSGFGSESVEQALGRLVPDSDYADRFARGDFQILGRHAVALQAAYSLTDAWALNAVWIGSLDGSGVVAPALSWNFSDNVTIVMSAYFSYGEGPDAGVPQSEYGSAPATAFLQISIYD